MTNDHKVYVNNNENCNNNVHYANKCYKSAIKNNNKMLRMSESLVYFKEGKNHTNVKQMIFAYFVY